MNDFMWHALEEAKKAFTKGEVPVGAVIVIDNEVIAAAHNSVETLRDPTAHAELLCIRSAAQKLGDWRLLGATLYTTLEPCSMCLGAALLARIGRVVYAAPDLRHGACGSWVNLLSSKHPTHELEIKGGILQDESAKLLREFFQEVRNGKVTR